MAEPVKRRTYDTTTRQARSASTRQRIIDSARRLVLEKGYTATTIAAVAEAAGVNTDTVYQLVGRKAMLVRELFEQSLSGADHAVTAEDREYVQRMRAEPDPAKKLAIYAHAIRLVQQRMAPLFLALRDASAVDAVALEVWNEISARRAQNMHTLVREIKATGRLRTGLGVDQAADVIWATNSSEFYVLLTIGRGWSPLRLERWLADSWVRLLLD